ncbi:hypothetical protein K435DRAFT_796184 [Dendrothele bispora CBS 962.96]|uniref:Uncharacterized protein n=1 Tax=Dendrothele bispora (strain CBS 962.96) TaxID=1314807 RepID=A0A4S8M690_DENBC|nr:hypothetical protein K435DRAFT_796184 [Dendrothele bispora CBS 962.96]
MSFIASGIVEQAAADELTSDYTSLSSSGSSPRIFSFWIPVILFFLCGLVVFFRKKYPCLVPSTLEKAIIDLDNVLLNYREEGGGTSHSMVSLGIDRDVLDSLSGSHNGVPHRSIRDRIRWRRKLLMEIIECYEDIRVVRRSIEQATEYKKQRRYSFEILCRDDALFSTKINGFNKLGEQ